MTEAANEKLVFEGYFCQSRSMEEGYGYSHYLCKFLPVKYRIEDEIDWIVSYEEVLVPPEGATWDDTIESDDIIDKLVPGKRYRVTIEEMEEAEGMQ